MRTDSRKLVKRLLSTTALGLALAMPIARPAISGPVDNPTNTGPSTTTAPYLIPTADVRTTSLLTAGDSIGGYKMFGIPDGLGAYDNGDGTISVLMNHEIPGPLPAGTTHSALGAGAFVSKWTINKNTLQVLSGTDLITATSYVNADGTTTPTSLQRLCSADLAPISAWYNAATSTGYNGYIFMNGEETTNGRALGNVVTGTGAVGTSYQLNKFGRQAWENLLANPGTGNKTVVIGNDDTTPGQVLVYVGDKQNSGTAVDQAGLTNGKLYAIKVTGVAAETRAPAAGTLGNQGVSAAFSLVEVGPGGDASGFKTTADTDTALNTAGATTFLRPEDGAWNPKNKNQYFFVTTDQFDQTKDGVGATIGRSRLWQVDFTDASDPTLGGTVKAVLDGTGPTQMLDNLTVGADGKIYLEEDVGGNAHNGKIWVYDPATGELKQILKHDPALFGDIGVAATAPHNQDEEASGIIDVTDLFKDASWYDGHSRIFLTSDQAHNAIADTFEDGQLLLLAVTEPMSFGLLAPAMAFALARRRRSRKS